MFTERVDRFMINDTLMAVAVAGIFDFDTEGRIVDWRDYYDWADLERQLVGAGVDMSARRRWRTGVSAARPGRRARGAPCVRTPLPP